MKCKRLKKNTPTSNIFNNSVREFLKTGKQAFVFNDVLQQNGSKSSQWIAINKVLHLYTQYTK